MKSFKIEANKFLNQSITGYYHEIYPFDNSHPVIILKNAFKEKTDEQLNSARDTIINKILADIPVIIEENNFDNCTLVSVPRSKANFIPSQLKFREAVSMASKELKITDGTSYIKRINNTYTTHFRNPVLNYTNDGKKPYPGITKDTCSCESNNIKDKDIILIDDVYTKDENVIEDCIQVLLDCGAKSVIHYSICKTPKGD